MLSKSHRVGGILCWNTEYQPPSPPPPRQPTELELLMEDIEKNFSSEKHRTPPPPTPSIGTSHREVYLSGCLREEYLTFESLKVKLS